MHLLKLGAGPRSITDADDNSFKLAVWSTATIHNHHRHHGSLTRYSFPLGGYEYGAALYFQ